MFSSLYVVICAPLKSGDGSKEIPFLVEKRAAFHSLTFRTILAAAVTLLLASPQPGITFSLPGRHKKTGSACPVSPCWCPNKEKDPPIFSSTSTLIPCLGAERPCVRLCMRYIHYIYICVWKEGILAWKHSFISNDSTSPEGDGRICQTKSQEKISQRKWKKSMFKH